MSGKNSEEVIKSSQTILVIEISFIYEKESLLKSQKLITHKKCFLTKIG